ncbi:MAG: hypothetical protein CMH98_14560 [Oceanospirillaceae bacterium]|nr:hypothetical protein [Oceanospirillaceae bacterium]
MALPAMAETSDSDIRISFIQNSLDLTEQHSRSWQYGWLGLFSAVTAVNGIAYSQTEGEHNKYDRVVGFTTSFLGAADMLMNPMRTHEYAGALESMPQQTPAQQSAKLRQAESWLAAAAARERYEQSFTSHALSALVNGLAGLAVAYDDKRPDDGWMTFLSGVVASEVKIYTAPQTMIEAEQAYRSGNYQQAAAKSDAPHWEVAAFGPYLSAQYRF